MDKIEKKHCLHKDKPDPERKCKNKNFTTKMMFMAAVARLSFNHSNNRWSNGLLGIWPFVVQKEAVQTSKNRTKGMLETKGITVGAKEHMAVMFEKNFPVTMKKWPAAEAKQTIHIQQDNARAHTFSIDRQVGKIATLKGWDIKIKRQPARSPDNLE